MIKNQQLRIFYIIEDKNKANSFLLRERRGHVEKNVSKIDWKTGTLNQSSVYVKRDTLLTAMTGLDGIPVVIYQGPGDNNFRQVYESAETGASANAGGWTDKAVNLVPPPYTKTTSDD